MKLCERCDNRFTPRVSYQIYCSDSCRESATKEKIAERYLIARRQKRKGKNRRCKSCNGTLSIYNDDVLCIKCNVNPLDVNKALKQIKGIINDKE